MNQTAMMAFLGRVVEDVGEARLRATVVTEAGFGSLRRVAEMPFNIVLED